MRRLRAGLAVVAAAVLVLAPAVAAVADSTPIPTGGYPKGVAISPDGTRAYATIALPGTPGRVDVIDTATDAIIGSITVGVEPLGVVVSPDGSRVYAANINDNSISVIDTASLTVEATWNPPASPAVTEGAWGLALDDSGSVLYASIRGAGTVEALDTSDGSSVASYPAPGLPAGLALDSASGTLYVARSQTQFVRRIDVGTGTATDLDPFGGPSPYLATLSPDGSELWVTSYLGTAIAVIDTASFTLDTTIEMGAVPRKPAFSGDGRVYVPLDSGAAAIITQATRTPVGTTPTGAGSSDAEVLPDLTHAYVANTNGGGLSFIGPPLVVAPPASLTVSEGSSAGFTAVPRATVDSLVWQQSRDGVAWSDIPGTAAAYSFASGPPSYSRVAALADDGLRIRVVLRSELFGEVASAPAVLRVSAVLAPSGAEVGMAGALGVTLLALGGVGLVARSRARRT